MFVPLLLYQTCWSEKVLIKICSHLKTSALNTVAEVWCINIFWQSQTSKRFKLHLVATWENGKRRNSQCQISMRFFFSQTLIVKQRKRIWFCMLSVREFVVTLFVGYVFVYFSLIVSSKVIIIIISLFTLGFLRVAYAANISEHLPTQPWE